MDALAGASVMGVVRNKNSFASHLNAIQRMTSGHREGALEMV